MPLRSLFLISQRFNNFIFPWSNCVLLHTSMQLLWVFLLYKLSMIIFFISKNKVMRRNTRRILHFIPSDLLPFRFRCLMFSFDPVTVLWVLPWPWSLRFFFHFLFLEPINSRSKAIRRLDDGYSEFFQSIHWQILHWLHRFRYLLETCLHLIWSRSYKIMISIWHNWRIFSIYWPLFLPGL